MNILAQAIQRSRATLVIILFILLAGLLSRNAMPVSVEPPISAPFVVVTVALEGASPEDGVRLLIRPMENEIKGLEGIEEITATAQEGSVVLIAEFEADMNMNDALAHMREAVDRAQSEFPGEAEEPVVDEVSATSSPDVIVAFSGNGIGERELFRTATRFQRLIQGVPDVMSAELIGAREEVVEALIDPERLEHYNLTAPMVMDALRANNLLIPAGLYEAGGGRFSVKVQGLLETREDIAELPILSSDHGAVTLSDLARVKRTFKDANQVARLNGERTVAVEVSKRTGRSTVEVVEAVKAVVEPHRQELGAMKLDYVFDSSQYSREMVDELQGNILTAMFLVLIVVVVVMGPRNGLLVAFSIPFCLLATNIFLNALGYTLNFMVMFGLLLALGMLIDGAVVVVEFAERQYRRGMGLADAYLLAVKRMAAPVIASTATTLAVFIPLLFWPGVMGNFMTYLPVTVAIVLVCSLSYALLFGPVLGVVMGQWLGSRIEESEDRSAREQIEMGSAELGRFGTAYANFMEMVLDHPLRTLGLALAVLIGVYTAYIQSDLGTKLLMETENQFGTATVRARGNLTIDEMDDLGRAVAERIATVPAVRSTFAVVGGGGITIRSGEGQPKDQIANIFVELVSARYRDKKSREVFADIRKAIEGFPGVIVSAEVAEGGPPVGKEIQVQVSSDDPKALYDAARKIRRHMDGMSGLRDLEDTLPLPGIEWRMEVDRPRAAMAGVNIAQVGQMLQLVTNGIQVGEYRPDDAEEEVDIRVRFPASERTLEALNRFKVTSAAGPVSPAAFVERKARPRVDSITRVNMEQIVMVRANPEEDALAATKVAEIQDWLERADIPSNVEVRFRGANEEQEESAAFLGVAFSAALFLMLILLVVQFNSYYQAVLILSAVIMSTAGVLLGLVITQEPFIVIMTGIGIVALGGIVVNNNIVLIDTYNFLRRERTDLSRREVVHLTAVLRLRPVLLTTGTTIIGLLPLANGVSIDFAGRSIESGGMIASWWMDLSSAVVHGLALATLLTLVVTPAMLLLPESLRRKVRQWREQRARGGSGEAAQAQ